MRKGFDGLYGMVANHLGRDPLSGDMFLFVARNRKRAKVLLQKGKKVPVTLIRYWVELLGESEDMPRKNRIFVEGGVYHVYNRLGRGERVFDQEIEAAAFVEQLGDVVKRDGLTVFAWSLLGNHYHLAVRTGVVSLDRPMRSLQQRVTRGVNLLAANLVWLKRISFSS